MAKKSLEKCKSGKDFLKYLEKQDVELKPGKGSHWKAKNKKGICIVPNHNNDLPTGTRRSILKTLAGMGIMVFLVGIVLQFGLF